MKFACRRSLALFLVFFPFCSHQVRRVGGRRVEIWETSLREDAAAEIATRNHSDHTQANQTDDVNLSGYSQVSQNLSLPVPYNNLHDSKTRSNYATVKPNNLGLSERVALAQTNESLDQNHATRDAYEMSHASQNRNSLIGKPANLGLSARVALALANESFDRNQGRHDAYEGKAASQHRNILPCIAKKLGAQKDRVCPNSLGCAVGCWCSFGSRCYARELKLDKDILASCPDVDSKGIEDGAVVNIGVCHWNLSVLVLLSIASICTCMAALLVARSYACTDECIKKPDPDDEMSPHS